MKKDRTKDNDRDKIVESHQQSPHEHIVDKKGHPKRGNERIAKKIQQHNSGGLA